MAQRKKTRRSSRSSRKSKEKWMQEVKEEIKRKGTEGAFRRYCQRKGYKKVTWKCIEEGKRSPNPKTRKRANLAAKFLKANKKRKKK